MTESQGDLKTPAPYSDFLKNKIKAHTDSGFIVSDNSLNPMLKDFQRHIVKRALKGGKHALFSDTGTGKTFMQLEWGRLVAEHTQGRILLLAPLAVTGQTIEEAGKWGIGIDAGEIGGGLIDVVNYDQIDNIDCSIYYGVILDESSILKNFEGETKKKIIDLFQNTPYKLACTATPSPNDHMELGNHSEFLNVMSRSQMLSMYFVHDGGETSKWRLKRHAVKDFWAWVNSWATMMIKPSDLGFSDEGYDLPPLYIQEHIITTKIKDNGKLFNDNAVSAITFNTELRETALERITTAAKIANATREQVIVWVKQNAEADLALKLIPGAVDVRGSELPEIKKKKLLGFGKNEYRVMVTKMKIAQFGMNYQNCHKQVVASPDFSFEGLYQAIRRSYRYGQEHPVTIDIISTDTMGNVIKSLNDKEKEFKKMQQEMRTAGAFVSTVNKNDAPIEVIENSDYTVMRGDCIKLIENVPDRSIGFSVFSPPFASLYTYSDHIEDMGNSISFDEFVCHFKFLVKELRRVIIQGRLVAVHCMDLPIQKGKEGYIGLRDFSGMIRQAFEDEGFIYHSRVTIWKNPVTEMQRTKALGLLHKQLKKDSTMSRVGSADYLLVFRDPEEGFNPVHTNIPVDLWQEWASPVWMNINQSDTLQRTSARDEKDEKHICPLQLSVIERAIGLWSNEGDTVFTPFMGIGSEVYQAIKMGRKGIGIELKETYFEQAVKNCEAAVKTKLQIQLW